MTSLQALLILLLIIFVVIAVIAMINSYQKENILKKIQADWGEETAIYRNFDRISMYSDHVSEHKLNEKTITDLNINEVFSKMDRCRSKIGQQYLYYILLTPTHDIDILKKRKKLIEVFSYNNDVRIKTEYQLANLNRYLGYTIPVILFDWEFKPLKNKLLIAALSILPIILIVLGMFVSCKFYILLFLSFFINLIFHYRIKSEVEFFITPFSQINRIRECAFEISNIDPELDKPGIQSACSKLKGLGRYQFLLSSEDQEQNGFSTAIWLLVEYVKITFLLEANLLNKCLGIANLLNSEIHQLYRYVGQMDACISIASYRTSLDSHCEPIFTNGNAELAIKNAYHPLVVDCVLNDLNTEGRGILITGSNMSGKTTFIRTVAINAILAQTIYTVCADSYKSSFLNVFSSIGIRDDLMMGKSYYLEEIESIYSFIEESQASGRNNLFVVDELFKGTNTVERIAAAKAVLQYLRSEKNIVIVSTHDMELANLLKGDYDLFHFEESVDKDGFRFDHKMKKGILKTRNAIRLLELFDFPEAIIKAANKHIDSSQV
jgi:DNA mismatch repair ATPase MutS